MSGVQQFLPWQIKTAQQWLSQRERFSHAWLIHGLAGIGKSQFALAAAASLLCEAPVEGLACGRCVACVWVAGGNHPDLRRIRPEAMALEEGGSVEPPESGSTKRAPSREIRVEQLRTLHDWFNTATHRGGWRVAVLYPAHALNLISANALLKVLEEPPEHTVFLVVADAPDRLLPTLVSRCRRLPLPVPHHRDCVQWLAEQGVSQPDAWLAAAGGAPLMALSLSSERTTACPEWLDELLSPLAHGRQADLGPVADFLEKQPTRQWIDTLQRLFVDLLLAASDAPVRYFPSLGPKVAATAQRASLLNLADTARWLTRQRALADHPLNAKLLVHSTLQRVVLACSATT